MKKVENYRPAQIEFVAESAEVPKFLGEKFKDAEEAHKFMNENFVATSARFHANRKLDQQEIYELREQYQEELEDGLPKLERDLAVASLELEHAKGREKTAKENVTASWNKIKALADEVREGVTEMNLDQAFTYELIYKGKRFYYTFIDNKFQLCGVREISEFDQEDLISSAERNANTFEKMSKASNE